jgi:hypothetical protein
MVLHRQGAGVSISADAFILKRVPEPSAQPDDGQPRDDARREWGCGPSA